MAVLLPGQPGPGAVCCRSRHMALYPSASICVGVGKNAGGCETPQLITDDAGPKVAVNKCIVKFGK